MGVPILFFCRAQSVLVLYLLFPALLLAVLILPETVHNLVNRLAVSAGLDPLLTGLLMLAATLFEHALLLPDGFPQAIEENPVILDAGGPQPTATGKLEVPGILVAVNTQLFQSGSLGIQMLLALAEFLHRILLAILCHPLHRLHAFGACHDAGSAPSEAASPARLSFQVTRSCIGCCRKRLICGCMAIASSTLASLPG